MTYLQAVQKGISNTLVKMQHLLLVLVIQVEAHILSKISF